MYIATILLLIQCCVGFKLLSLTQYKDLQYYVSSNKTTPSMRKKAQCILFHRHLPLVYSKVSNFRSFHRRKCKHIVKDDLLFYGYKGLYNCVQNYNGRSNFVKFASIYINGALYTGLTAHTPISKQSKKERGKAYIRNYNDDNHKNIYLNTRDYLKTNIHHQKFDHFYNYAKIWKFVDTLPPFSRRLFHYKFDFWLEKKRTNAHIAELMCCSEEWVRRNIHKVIVQINNTSLDIHL